MAKKIIKTGNSAAVTVPHEFMEALNLKIGDTVKVEIDFETGTLTYKFPARQLILRTSKKRRKRPRNR